mmetsp:Transcript_26824/g.61859  ORF Transcript_26824/g.61859 Transcript_26824/m.61859 type:complete len:208 (+) Transcript_26824:42-665(+)
MAAGKSPLSWGRCSASRRRTGTAVRLLALIGSVVALLSGLLRQAFVSPSTSSPGQASLSRRVAVARRSDLDVAAPPKGTKVTIIKGAQRYPVPWGPGESVDALRERVEEATGVPVEKQTLILGKDVKINAGVEGELGVFDDFAKGGVLKQVWLEDTRSKAERGEEVEEFDLVQTVANLGPIEVFTIIVAAYELWHDGIPLLFLERTN